MDKISQLCINTVRVLSAEAIEKAKSGHPGMPLGAAPIAFSLYTNHLRVSNKAPKFDNRDRFVLSAGHGSMLQYSMLHLLGFDITMDDIKEFRQLGAKTAGHPEYSTFGPIETTTGPLGQGIANAVGMAIAEQWLASKFNKPNRKIVDHYTYALCGEGCLMEGIEYEAASLAGTLKLGKLIVLYDKNNITIEGKIEGAFTEDVGKRHEAQGWQVIYVDDANDIDAIDKAIESAKAETEKPSLIICKSIIGYGSPLAGSSDCHGAPLGATNLKALKEYLGYDYPAFTVPQEVYDYFNGVMEQKNKMVDEWNELFALYEKEYPELAEQYKSFTSGKYPDLTDFNDLFVCEKEDATRSHSSVILNKLTSKIENLFGGSADLGPSNKTIMKNSTYFSAEDRSGSNVHFGIREHAMGAIINGMATHTGILPYCSTFFVFSDYMKNAIRLSALMNLKVIYIFTHDSIGVGEDGPTHQPVEQLIALRSIPNLRVFRPAGMTETACAWISALNHDGPSVFVLSRQTLPNVGCSKEALKGGYVVKDEKDSDLILIGTGSELSLCAKAAENLKTKGVKARVVSIPCIELFESQSEEYKESVLPKNVTKRIIVEAGSPYSWYKYVKDGEIIGMSTFGKSAPAEKLFEYFGFTAENVTSKALELLGK